ncbi:MAG: NTP transferase domain-containing protein [Alphaproteobacteria bacterium]
MTDDPEPRRATALVLAAGRGPDEPIALRAGVAHKALVPIGGVPMLARVVRALEACGGVARIAISIDRAATLAACPELARKVAEGRLEVLASRSSASTSVAAAFDALPLPLLVTTADHALLTPAMVDHFWSNVPAGVDLAVGVVDAQRVEAAFPGVHRTFLGFRDGALKGTNLFAFLTPAARRAADFWQRAERHRKHPLRLLAQLGPLTGLAFALRLLTRARAVRRLERRLGLRIALVPLPFAEAAIDVDKAEDMALAEAVLAGRGEASPP